MPFLKCCALVLLLLIPALARGEADPCALQPRTSWRPFMNLVDESGLLREAALRSFAPRWQALQQQTNARLFSQEALGLAADLQRDILERKSQSPVRALLWASVLLATEQNDIAYRILQPLPKSDLQRMLLGESLSALRRRTEARGIFAQVQKSGPKGQLFLSWRKAELELDQNNLSAAWSAVSPRLAQLPAELNESSQSLLLRFGQSRLAPHEFWTQLPPAVDRERLALCILRSSAPELAQKAAFKQLMELPKLSERSLEFAHVGLIRLMNLKASRPSQTAWLRSTLAILLRGPDKASPTRSKLLATTLKAMDALVQGARPGTDGGLSVSLQEFIQQGRADETLAFRHRLARLYENTGEWRSASAVYAELWPRERDESNRPQLARLWLRASKKGLVPLDSKRPALLPAESRVAAEYLSACDVFTRAWPMDRLEQMDCARYSIQLAIHSGDDEQATRRLWLYVSNFPNKAIDILRSMVGLYQFDAPRMIASCEKLLRIPQLQGGESGQFLRDNLRTAKYSVIASLPSELDRAAAYAAFAEQERPHPLALQAITKAVQLSQADWKAQIIYLKTYVQKFRDGPDALRFTLLAAQLYEKNFALQESRMLLKSTAQLSWTREQDNQRSELLCRLDTLLNPIEGLISCLEPMRGQHKLAVDLARELARFGESSALARFVLSSEVDSLPLRIDDRIALLNYGMEGTASIPKLQDDIRQKVYEVYAENHEGLNADSRRHLSILAYRAASQSLPKYLDMPIYAAQSQELLPAIQSKKGAYKELETLYGKVLQTKDPYWGVKALADLSVASLNLSDSLKNLPPMEGLEPKTIETELRAPTAQWNAKGKSYAAAALKTMERFGLLHENARSMLLDMQRIRGDRITWVDRLPVWGDDESF